MQEPKILKNFFEDQHRKWKQRTYLFHQCTCGNCAKHSEHGEWLKHRSEEHIEAVPTPSQKPAHHAPRD